MIRNRHPPTDDPAILRMIRRRLLPLNPPAMRRTWTDRELKKRLAGGMTRVWVPDGRTCARARPGAFITFFVRGAELFIDMLAVDEPFQRAGIGGQLLRQAERYGIARGCTSMRLYVNDDNAAGIRFYAKHGMTAVRHDPRCRSYMMEKRIG